MTVDYSRSACDIFREVTISLLFREEAKKDGTLIASILSQSQGEGQLPLPSWVPDWSRPSNSDFKVMDRSISDFRAGGKDTLQVWPTDDPNKIRLKGKVFDSIHACSSIAPSVAVGELETALDFLGKREHYFQNLLNEHYLMNCWIEEASNPVWSCQRYQNDKHKIAAFSRTLICNNIQEFYTSTQLSFDLSFGQF